MRHEQNLQFYFLLLPYITIYFYWQITQNKMTLYSCYTNKIQMHIKPNSIANWILPCEAAEREAKRFAAEGQNYQIPRDSILLSSAPHWPRELNLASSLTTLSLLSLSLNYFLFLSQNFKYLIKITSLKFCILIIIFIINYSNLFLAAY